MTRTIRWRVIKSGRWDGLDMTTGVLVFETAKYAAGWKLRVPRGCWSAGPFKTFDEMANAAETRRLP